MAHEAGKGSAQRPTDHQTYSANFDRIFGKKGPRPAAVSLPIAAHSDFAIAAQVNEAALVAANDEGSGYA